MNLGRFNFKLFINIKININYVLKGLGCVYILGYQLVCGETILKVPIYTSFLLSHWQNPICTHPVCNRAIRPKYPKFDPILSHCNLHRIIHPTTSRSTKTQARICLHKLSFEQKAFKAILVQTLESNSFSTLGRPNLLNLDILNPNMALILLNSKPFVSYEDLKFWLGFSSHHLR